MDGQEDRFGHRGDRRRPGNVTQQGDLAETVPSALKLAQYAPLPLDPDRAVGQDIIAVADVAFADHGRGPRRLIGV